MRVTGNAIDYDALTDLMARAGSPLVLAEFHGGLCGVICAGGRDAAARWLGELLDDCTADTAAQAELADGLEALCTATWKALTGLALEFEPLLPEAEDSIAARTDALALWCHGFLAGLVVGGLDLASGQADLPPELTELVEDFAEISKAGADEADNAETSDASLTELAEFVRVGVQFVFEELTQEPDSPGQRVLH